ncbi:MAG: UDP-N-acetylmuramate dehydrogenase [candidate division Zixibacteria bacterium]|nr:UDP-N-acetylmuramate dehydrogenase [candidate division Zixibacteria bacterium]
MKATVQLPLNQNIPESDVAAAIGDTVEFDKPLAPLTSFRTGGPAKYFIAVRSVDEIVRAISGACRLDIPYVLIGGGSNLLISDAGFDGLVIKIAIAGIQLVGETTIECGAGENLMAVVEFAASKSLTGLEFAAGIWGTAGGAVYGNAGAYGGGMSDVVTEVVLIDSEGKTKTRNHEYCRFAYRDSYLKMTKEVIVTVRIKLQKGEPGRIREKIADILADRKTKHPDQLTAGCFFKNIEDPSQPHGKLAAGRLLEEAGAKLLSVGDAEVFEKHANMIVNVGHATSHDIHELATRMKELVRKNSGVELEEEITRIGQF